MSASKKLMVALSCLIIVTGGSSCRAWNKVFGPKYGCPTNGKSYGAERILSGEKPPKTKKFKA
jgi:hypothetical protein